MGKVRLDTALELSLYLSRETETMAVTQGFQELVPLYKLMEKRDMADLENKMKVRKEARIPPSAAVELSVIVPSLCVQGYIVDLFRGLIDRQEWADSGSVSERVLRSYLLLFGCVRNYLPCVEKATQLFNEWRASGGHMRSGVSVLSFKFKPVGEADPTEN